MARSLQADRSALGGRDLRWLAPCRAAGDQRADAADRRRIEKNQFGSGRGPAGQDRQGPRRADGDSFQPPRAGAVAAGQAVARGGKTTGRAASEQAGLRKQMRDVAAKPDTAERKPAVRAAGARAKTTRRARRPAWRGGSSGCRPSNAGRSTAGALPARWARRATPANRETRPRPRSRPARAEKDLEEAQQQLAERRRQAEEDLAREQIAKLEDSLKSLQQAAAEVDRRNRPPGKTAHGRGQVHARASQHRPPTGSRTADCCRRKRHCWPTSFRWPK